MNPYVTGGTIKSLREKAGLTQADLARRLQVSDKTISKWETGKGYPDISLLEPIAEVFHLSVAELLTGKVALNANVSGNISHSVFYVCPVCGNSIHSMGEAAISCHGIALQALVAEMPNEAHGLQIDRVEDDYFLHLDHPMTKDHFISFMAALSPDRMQFVKLYPEGNAEARFSTRGVKAIYYYCNQDGLFMETIRRSKPQAKAHRLPF